MRFYERLDAGENSGADFQAAIDVLSPNYNDPDILQTPSPNSEYAATVDELLEDINIQLRNIEQFEALKLEFPDHGDFDESLAHAHEQLEAAQARLSRLTDSAYANND